MFHGHLLRGDALDEACEGTDADEFLDRRKGRYTNFARTHLLQRVGLVVRPLRLLLGQLALVLDPVLWRDHSSVPGLYLVKRGHPLALLKMLAVPPALPPRQCYVV